MLRYLGAMWQCRYFWLSLVKMDLRSRYRGSVLGLGWSLAHPLGMALVLCAAFTSVFRADVKTYVPYLLLGLIFWTYVLNTALLGCRCLLGAEGYIRQFPAPMAIYPLRTALAASTHFVLALGVVMLLTWCLRGEGYRLRALLSLGPSLVLLLVFGWSLAALAGLAHVYFRDTEQLAQVGFQALFYLTPIMYPPGTSLGRSLNWSLRCNPLVPFLNLVRAPVLEGRFPSSGTFTEATIIALVFAGVAAASLWRLEPRVIFYL